MRMKILTITTVALLLTGCSTTTVDDRAERAAVAMHTVKALDSKIIADGLAERGLFDQIATDLVDICDDGSTSPYAYLAGFDDASMEPVIMAGWAVACPD